MSLRNSVAGMGSSPKYLRLALIAARMKLVIDTPGISTGYWNDRNSPSWERSSGESDSRSTPWKLTLPLK